MAEKVGTPWHPHCGRLISFYPRRYQDWTQITKMEDLVSGEESVIYGRILM